MVKIRGTAVLTFVALLAGLSGPGIVEAQIHWEIGVDGLLGLTRGEFAENVESNAFGVSGTFTRRIARTPLHVGAEISFLEYGEESRRQPLSPSIPEINVKVSTANQMLLTHFVARVEAPTGPLRPYFDGLVGLNYIFTRSTVEDDGEPLASSTNFDDVASSLGFGGGVLVPLRTRDAPSGERKSELHLNVGARYLFGGRAEYLTEGSLSRENGEIVLAPLESRTDLLVLQFGVLFRF